MNRLLGLLAVIPLGLAAALAAGTPARGQQYAALQVVGSVTPGITPVMQATATPYYQYAPLLRGSPLYTPTPTPPAPPATATPAPTSTPVPTPTPSVVYSVAENRRLECYENTYDHHIIIRVRDVNWQPLDGVPVKVFWGNENDPNTYAILYTETKFDWLRGELKGYAEFPMYPGSYNVRVQGESSDAATGITPNWPDEAGCDTNKYGHYSYSVIFRRRY